MHASRSDDCLATIASRPPPTKDVIRFTDAASPQAPICAPLHDLTKSHLQLVSSLDDSRLWNEYIERDHDPGHKPLPGAQQRYFATINNWIVDAFGSGATPPG